MNNLWWLALAVLALPVWWHRQKRERVRAKPLATARFLPRSDPQQLRVWRWTDRILLALRCLMLACLVAWLAGLAFAWRGDSVLVAAGTDAAWAAQQIREAGFGDARRIDLPQGDSLAWLHQHEAEWQPAARLLVVGSLPMPASLPQFRHRVELRTRAAPDAASERHIAIVSQRADRWRALFAALGEPKRYIVDSAPGDKSDLIIWDTPDMPPAGLRAPLWWIGDATAIPELKQAASVDGMRYADSARGRLWMDASWPPADADGARALFEKWQRLHYAPAAFPAPSQVFVATESVPLAADSGALRQYLMIMLVALFALERLVAHARRR